jgi:hypothetical protein
MMSAGRSILDNLREKGWTLAENQKHDLCQLHGQPLGAYKLVVLLGGKNRFGATHFQLYLRDAGEISLEPAVIGLYNRGRYPSYNWIEIIRLSSSVSFTSGAVVDLRQGDLMRTLLQRLADLLPPGGHMMIEYASAEQQDTARSLALGIPSIATPLGHLLFSIGCGAAFKDWHFAEGGWEGPCKLQGFKPLDAHHAKAKANEIAEELTVFLNSPPRSEISHLEKEARERAGELIRRLRE